MRNSRSASLLPVDPSQGYPFYYMCPWEDEKEKDQKRIQELYPLLARQIQPLVEEECDRMEYDGSFMFDVFPDRLWLMRLTDRIYDQVGKQELKDDMRMQSVESPSVWLKDLISVMLLNEMYHRRCRRRDRKCGRIF